MAEVEIAKPFYKSTTLWLNFLAIVAVGLQYISDTKILDPQFQALVLALLNLANRFRTSVPVRV